VLGIALELSRILQRDPLSPESMRVLQSHLQTAARACYRKHHSLFLGDRPKERSNSVNEHDDSVDNGRDNGHRSSNGNGSSDDPGHGRLFTGLSQLCLVGTVT
jgi:hypothetical protein